MKNCPKTSGAYSLSPPSGEGQGEGHSVVAQPISKPTALPLTPTLSPKGEREKQVRARENSLSPPRGEGQGEGCIGPNRSPEARDFARQLRRQATDAEKRLWRLLRGRHFQGYKFRRQYAYGEYFLDFYCVEARLAVELDGGGHGTLEQRSKDQRREAYFASQGIKILRFWNHKVRQQIDSVRFEIWHALMERTGQAEKIAHYLPRKHPLTPTLSPKGEKEKQNNSRAIPLSPARGEGQGEGSRPFAKPSPNQHHA